MANILSTRISGNAIYCIMLLDNSQSRSSSWDQDRRNWGYLNLLSNVKQEEDLQAISMAELVPTRAANASSDMAL